MTIYTEDAPDNIDCLEACKQHRFVQTIVFLFLGQVLSLCLVVTGVSSQYLAEFNGVETPAAQNFISYILIAVIFTSYLSCQHNDDGLVAVFFQRGWKYFILALIDLEANYLIVRAYQYTTATSVQLIDCFTIPTVLILSFFFLRVRYGILHIVGVSLCLLGVGAVVWSDFEQGNASFEGGNSKWIGDLLCLGGATLYGVVNVAEESLVKKFARSEYLGMIGFFGSVLAGIQLAVLERDTLARIQFDNYIIFVCYGAYALAMLIFYSLVTVILQNTSATFFNLSLLTADSYTLIAGIFVFKQTFHTLYFVSFGLVLVGTVVYFWRPTMHRDGSVLKESPSLQQTMLPPQHDSDERGSANVLISSTATSFHSLPRHHHQIGGFHQQSNPGGGAASLSQPPQAPVGGTRPDLYSSIVKDPPPAVAANNPGTSGQYFQQQEHHQPDSFQAPRNQQTVYQFQQQEPWTPQQPEVGFQPLNTTSGADVSALPHANMSFHTNQFSVEPIPSHLTGSSDGLHRSGSTGGLCPKHSAAASLASTPAGSRPPTRTGDPPDIGGHQAMHLGGPHSMFGRSKNSIDHGAQPTDAIDTPDRFPSPPPRESIHFAAQVPVSSVLNHQTNDTLIQHVIRTPKLRSTISSTPTPGSIDTPPTCGRTLPTHSLATLLAVNPNTSNLSDSMNYEQDVSERQRTVTSYVPTSTLPSSVSVYDNAPGSPSPTTTTTSIPYQSSQHQHLVTNSSHRTQPGISTADSHAAEPSHSVTTTGDTLQTPLGNWSYCPRHGQVQRQDVPTPTSAMSDGIHTIPIGNYSPVPTQNRDNLVSSFQQAPTIGLSKRPQFHQTPTGSSVDLTNTSRQQRHSPVLTPVSRVVGASVEHINCYRHTPDTASSSPAHPPPPTHPKPLLQPIHQQSDRGLLQFSAQARGSSYLPGMLLANPAAFNQGVPPPRFAGFYTPPLQHYARPSGLTTGSGLNQTVLSGSPTRPPVTGLRRLSRSMNAGAMVQMRSDDAAMALHSLIQPGNGTDPARIGFTGGVPGGSGNDPRISTTSSTTFLSSFAANVEQTPAASGESIQLQTFAAASQPSSADIRASGSTDALATTISGESPISLGFQQPPPQSNFPLASFPTHAYKSNSTEELSSSDPFHEQNLTQQQSQHQQAGPYQQGEGYNYDEATAAASGSIGIGRQSSGRRVVFAPENPGATAYFDADRPSSTLSRSLSLTRRRLTSSLKKASQGITVSGSQENLRRVNYCPIHGSVIKDGDGRVISTSGARDTTPSDF